MGEFNRTLTFADFTGIKPTESDVLLVAATWNRVGTFQIPKGVKLAIGQRFDTYFYIHLEDTLNADVIVAVRIVASDPTNYNKRVIFESATAECTEGTTDKDLMRYLPIRQPWIGSDSKLHIEMYPLTASPLEIDVSHADTKMRLPVTFKV